METVSNIVMDTVSITVMDTVYITVMNTVSITVMDTVWLELIKKCFYNYQRVSWPLIFLIMTPLELTFCQSHNFMIINTLINNERSRKVR